MKINTYTPPKSTKICFGAKLPPKTTIITKRNGKDVIADEFIGYYVRRGNPLDVFINLISNFCSFIENKIKK